MTKMTPIPQDTATTTEDTQILPVPEGVAPPRQLNTPSFVAAYDYRDTEGALLVTVARFERPDASETTGRKKWFSPFTYWQVSNGSHEWRAKTLPAPRPVYRLPDLVQRPDAPVVVSEGEKAAHAAACLFPEAISTTWMGGSNALEKTDFAPLAGRDVILLPDNDAPGTKAMDKLAFKLQVLGLARLRRLDIAALAARAPEDARSGYDLADSVESGMTAAAFKASCCTEPGLLIELPSHAESAQTILENGDDPILAHLREEYGADLSEPEGFEIEESGVYHIDVSGRRGDKQVFVCSPLAVIGHTRTGLDGAGWGYLVTFLNPIGEWDTAVVPSRMLAGDGREMREMLMQRGLRCAQDRAGREALGRYIQNARSPRITEIAVRPGWIGASFVLPGLTITGRDSSETSAMLDLQDREHDFRRAGAVEDWQALAGLAENNSRAAFALSVAFAGPLLRELGEDSGGFHLHGSSSRGKTTVLKLAGSVWGGGRKTGFVRPWKSTDNGLEGIAVDHNDTLLALDEIGLAPAEKLVEICYMLMNGQGKIRAGKTGKTQPVAHWRAMVLSSGEDAFAKKVETNSQLKRSRVPAGVTVRMLDIPMVGADETSFEDLSGFATEESYIDHLRTETNRHYGHAGPLFIKRFLDNPDAHAAATRAVIERLSDAVTRPTDDPQVKRVARHFGMAAAAGTLATRLGVLPWQDGAAFEAAVTCFEAWKARRDTSMPDEEREIIRSLRAFFEQHGAARFEPLGRRDFPEACGADWAARSSASPVRDRCGYRVEDTDDGVVYYVTPEAWRMQICADRDATYVARIARKHGALVPGENNRLQKKVRLPDYPNSVRLYVIRPDHLPLEEGVEASEAETVAERDR